MKKQTSIEELRQEVRKMTNKIETIKKNIILISTRPNESLKASKITQDNRQSLLHREEKIDKTNKRLITNHNKEERLYQVNKRLGKSNYKNSNNAGRVL